MIDLYLRSLLVSTVALVALALAHRASAPVRHVLAVAGLVATLAVPLFLAVLPSVRLTVLPRSAVPASPVIQTSQIETVAAPAAPTLDTVPEAAPKPIPWGALWIAGSLVLILRWLAGWLWLALRLRRAEPVTGLGFDVPVLESDVFRVPVTAWTERTVLVLPLGWREWPVERREAALRHEMAHVRRGDGLTLLVARLACAALWPNPLVWILARLESRLAERATDDLVLADGFSAPQYAEALLHLARGPLAKGSLPALGMAGKAQVSHRVEMILDPKIPRTPASPNARRAAFSVALLAALPVALLGFDPPAPAMPNSSSATIALPDLTNRPVFRLRYKVVRMRKRGVPVQLFPLGAEMPSVDVREGQPSAFQLKATGRVHTIEIRGLRGEFLANDLRPGRGPVLDRVGVSERPHANGASDPGHEANYFAHPNGWLRYPLFDAHGKPTDDLLLLYFTRLDGDDAAPMASPVPSPAKYPPEATKSRVLVECTLLQATEPIGEPLGRRASEALLKGRADVAVLSHPKLFTFDGMEARIKTSRPVKVNTLTVEGKTPKVGEVEGSFDTEIWALPMLGGKDGGRLRFGAKVGVAGMGQTTRTETVRLRVGEPYALRLPPEKGSRTYYVLLARLTVFKGDEAPSPRLATTDRRSLR